MNKLFAVLVFGITLSLTGCGGCNNGTPTKSVVKNAPAEPFKAHKIDKVGRVFAQGVGGYSVMYETDGKVVEHKFVTNAKREAKIIMDVPEDGQMWVDVEEHLATIHVRSLDDIGSGRKTTETKVKTGKHSSRIDVEHKDTNVVK
jgi:hypothetical protein